MNKITEVSDWHTVKHKTMLKTKEKQCFSKREEIPHLWVTLTHKTAICCWDDNEAPHSSTQPTDVPLPFLQVLHSNPTLKAECKGPWMVPTEQENPQLYFRFYWQIYHSGVHWHNHRDQGCLSHMEERTAFNKQCWDNGQSQMYQIRSVFTPLRI